MSMYQAKHALGFKLKSLLHNTDLPMLKKSDYQQWWILFDHELWRCPITCIWLCSYVYCYAPLTGTITGSIGYTPGVIAGVAAERLSLSLLFSTATGVITFLSIRRCYNKKSSPPFSNEKSVYYEAVHWWNCSMKLFSQTVYRCSPAQPSIPAEAIYAFMSTQWI